METDEGLLEKYLEGEEVTGEALEKAFHEAVRRGLLYPVALASGEREIGVLPLLELILEALPSPTERFGDGPPLAKVFKVQVDPFMGQVAYLRLYRGRLKPGDSLQSEAGQVRLPHLYVPMGKDLLEVEEAEAGFVLGVPKAEGLHRGMVLWQGEKPESEEVPFARLPDPNVPVALHPKGRTDEARLGEALRKLLRGGPEPEARAPGGDGGAPPLGPRGAPPRHRQGTPPGLRGGGGVLRAQGALPGDHQEGGRGPGQVQEADRGARPVRGRVAQAGARKRVRL